MLENLTEKETLILEGIKTVIDPEVEINVVFLGLIYEVKYSEVDNETNIKATLSARGCPVGDTILNHIKIAAEAALPGSVANVELVWEPQWTPEMITDEGKAALNM